MANEKKCGRCKFGHFPIDSASETTMWQGRCFALMLTKPQRPGQMPKAPTVFQHFNCSNNLFEPKK